MKTNKVYQVIETNKKDVSYNSHLHVIDCIDEYRARKNSLFDSEAIIIEHKDGKQKVVGHLVGHVMGIWQLERDGRVLAIR